MKIKIYQIDMDRDVNRVKFTGLAEFGKYQGSAEIDASLYDEVFAGDVECTDLESVYAAFNTMPQPLHRGHSLSVSDVVATEEGAFYCDRVGFRKVSFEESLVHKNENLHRVIYVEPNKRAYLAEIEDTLQAEQRAVLGNIEIIYNGDGTCIVCNDEAKLCGMPGNRRLGDGHTVIAGPFFVIGEDGDEFRSLTEEEAERYLQRFAQPEEISQEEVEADMGITFYSLK